MEEGCKIKYDPENSVFPPYSEIKMTEENYLKEIPDDMKMTEPNWINFGNTIVKLYYYLIENGYVSVQESISSQYLILLLYISRTSSHGIALKISSKNQRSKN